MQTSMWKLLTAAGIIGIGTLVVLEVQNRLPAQSQTDGSNQATGLGNPGESVVIPESTTDLDRMLADNIGFDDPPFTLDEPTAPNDPGAVVPPFDEIKRTEAAPVDPTVLEDSLADDPNLFDRSIGTENQLPASDNFAESLSSTATADTIKSVNFSPESVATAPANSPTTASKLTTMFFNGSGQTQETNPVAARPAPASKESPTSAVTAAPVATPPTNDAAIKLATTRTPASPNQVTPASAQVTGDGRAAIKTSALPVEAAGQTDEEPVELFLPDEPSEFDRSNADVPAPRNPSTPRSDSTDDVPLMNLPGFDADEKKEFEFTPAPKNSVKPERPVVPAPAPDESIEFFDADELLRTTPGDLPPEDFPEPTFPDRKSVPPLDENAPFGSGVG
ncbi:MAG: hypothetical protein O2856_02920, partial [Planctomycetota bacterium]|nr:hypothetical protein [Planctomycetota bacterium]